jgi:hypothetical protein
VFFIAFSERRFDLLWIPYIATTKNGTTIDIAAFTISPCANELLIDDTKMIAHMRINETQTILEDESEYTNGQQIIIANNTGIGTSPFVSSERMVGAPICREFPSHLALVVRVSEDHATSAAAPKPAFRRMSVNGDATLIPTKVCLSCKRPRER